MERGRHVVAVELNVVVHSVGRQHHAVVVAQGYECARRHARHVQVVAIAVLVLFPRVAAQQVVVRALMGNVGHHGYHRIEQYLEVGARVLGCMRGNGRCQMAACRRAHYAHVVGIYVPVGGVAAHQSDGLLGVRYGHILLAVRHSVFQHDGSYAHVVEERRPVVALMVHGQMLVAASGTYHHGASRGRFLFRKKHLDLCRVARVAALHGRTVGPKVYFITLLCAHVEAQCQHRCRK